MVPVEIVHHSGLPWRWVRSRHLSSMVADAGFLTHAMRYWQSGGGQRHDVGHTSRLPRSSRFVERRIPAAPPTACCNGAIVSPVRAGRRPDENARLGICSVEDSVAINIEALKAPPKFLVVAFCCGRVDAFVAHPAARSQRPTRAAAKPPAGCLCCANQISLKFGL